MRDFLKGFSRRFSQGSSWAGISALLMLAGVPAGVPEIVVQVGSGIAALVAFAIDDTPK